jgi:hypothetical protein
MLTNPQQWLMVSGFLAVIAVVPVAQGIVEAFDGQVPQCFDLLRHVPTQANLRTFEKDLEDRSIFAQSARPWIQYARFIVFRDAGEKVLFGRDGWLFYRPDVRYLVDSAPIEEEDPLDAVRDFRDQLAARGIHLIVIPMPGKPSIYGNMLTRRIKAPQEVLSPTTAWIERLRASDIETVDLFHLFEEVNAAPYYLARDTHWSPEAAERAAVAVAQHIRELGWIADGLTQYDVRPVDVNRSSDIARMTRVPLIEAAFPAERVVSHQVFEQSSGAKYRDDPTSPVLVLGDSFLRIYQTDAPTSAGFIAHLARELRQPVASVVNDGGASTLVRQELARRPKLLAGKKVVIWEFVERDIRFGTEGWKRVPLSPDTRAAMPAPFRNP